MLRRCIEGSEELFIDTYLNIFGVGFSIAVIDLRPRQLATLFPFGIGIRERL